MIDKSIYCKDLLKLKPVAIRVAKNDSSLADDLLMEAIEVFLKSDVEIKNLRHAQNYVAKTIYQLYGQSNNSFTETYRQFEVQRSVENVEAEDEVIEWAKRECVNVNLITVAMDNVYWYNRELLKLKMQGMSYREIAAHTGIKFSSVYVAVEKARKQIKDYLNIND